MVANFAPTVEYWSAAHIEAPAMLALAPLALGVSVLFGLFVLFLAVVSAPPPTGGAGRRPGPGAVLIPFPGGNPRGPAALA